MMRIFLAVLKRDLLLAIRNKSDIIIALFFFLIVVFLFPLAIGIEQALLKKIAPGIAWVAALLASILVLDRLFVQDFDDGTLEQMLLSPSPLGIVVAAKILSHWILTGLTLVLISPLVGLLYHLDSQRILVLMLALLLGTPILSLLGAVGAALTLGLRNAGVLIALLVLPLYIPILIYGTGMVEAVRMGGSELEAYWVLLGGFLLLSLVLAPLAISASLRVAVE